MSQKRCKRCKRKWRPGPGIEERYKEVDKEMVNVRPPCKKIRKCGAGMMCGAWSHSRQAYCILPIHKTDIKHQSESGERWRRK